MLLKSNNNEVLIWSLIIGMIFIIIFMPVLQYGKRQDRIKLKEKFENMFSGEPKFLFSNKCARSCCINSGWPYPPELLEKDIGPEELKKYIPTNFSCALGSNLNGGCLCVTQPDYDYLTKRGGNMPNI
jgi:hypothetical protein